MLFNFSIISTFINKYIFISKLKKFNQTDNKLDEIFLSTPRESISNYNNLDNLDKLDNKDYKNNKLFKN
jgi:hypothetical protein